MTHRAARLFFCLFLFISLPLARHCCAQAVPTTPAAPPPSSAQTAPAATPASMMVTIYQRDDHASPGLVSIDRFKDDSDKFEARNPPEAEPLFALLLQGSRSFIARTPPVDAAYMIERSDPAASYAVSRRGIIWAGDGAYQLSKDDFKSFRSLIEKIEQSADSIDGLSLWSNGDNGIPKHLDKAIVVEFSVDVRGRPNHPRVVKSCGDKRLDDAACDAVLSQRFKPSLLNGVPQATRYMHIFVVDDQAQ